MKAKNEKVAVNAQVVNAAKEKPSVNEPRKGTYLMIDPKGIVIQEDYNVRYDYGDLQELKRSIIENGIQVPLKGYLKDGKYILKSGHRRYQAVMLAIREGHQIVRVPLMIEGKPENEEQRTLEMILDNDGKPLTMLEQSEVIKRLLNFGWRETDIVKKTGKARGYIDNLVLLTKAPVKLQGYIREGKISAHAVIQIMRAVKGDEKKVVEAAEEAMKNAELTGKSKATPKHVSQKGVKAAGFGSFYKWVDDLSNRLTETKHVSKAKADVVYKLLVAFEDKKKVEKFIAEFFVEKKTGK